MKNIIIVLFLLTNIVNGQNIVGKTFLRTRTYQKFWVTFYLNGLYRTTVDNSPTLFCADSGIYSIERSVILFSSIYKQLINSKSNERLRITPMNGVKLKIISDTILVNLVRLCNYKKTGDNKNDPGGKTWYKKDTIGVHNNIKYFKGCIK